MDKITEYMQNSSKHLKIADHMLTQTYPAIKDPKLLLAVLESLFLAFANAISAVLLYERLMHNAPPFQDNFDSKFNVFKMAIARKYMIDPDHINMIQDIKNTIAMHKKSPVEFARKGKFVICSDEYQTMELADEKMKKMLSKAKVFIQTTANIVEGKWKKPYLIPKKS